MRGKVLLLFLRKSEMLSLKSPEVLELEWILDLGDVPGRVLQLDDKSGMMFGKKGCWVSQTW